MSKLQLVILDEIFLCLSQLSWVLIRLLKAIKSIGRGTLHCYLSYSGLNSALIRLSKGVRSIDRMKLPYCTFYILYWLGSVLISITVNFTSPKCRESFKLENFRKFFGGLLENFSGIRGDREIFRSDFLIPKYLSENRKIFGNAGDAGEKPWNSGDLVEICSHRRAIRPCLKIICSWDKKAITFYRTWIFFL